MNHGRVRLCGRFLLALSKQQEQRGAPLKEPHFTALTSKGHVVKLVWNLASNFYKSFGTFVSVQNFLKKIKHVGSNHSCRNTILNFVKGEEFPPKCFPSHRNQQYVLTCSIGCVPGISSFLQSKSRFFLNCCQWQPWKKKKRWRVGSWRGQCKRCFNNCQLIMSTWKESYPEWFHNWGSVCSQPHRIPFYSLHYTPALLVTPRGNRHLGSHLSSLRAAVAARTLLTMYRCFIYHFCIFNI